MSAARTWCVGASLLALVSHVGNAARAAEPEKIVNSVGMPLVAIPAGQFAMGAPESEAGSRIDERPSARSADHQVLFLGQFEVTQSEYQTVTGVNPSHFKRNSGREGHRQTDRFPVEQVSWEQAIEFCRLLSATGRNRRRSDAPVADRGGCAVCHTKLFHYGKSLSSKQANINGNFPMARFSAAPVRVGSYLPNAYGLYDMHGNVADDVGLVCPTLLQGFPGRKSDGAEKGATRSCSGAAGVRPPSRCAFRRSNATSAAYFFDSAWRATSSRRKSPRPAKKAEEAASEESC
ncbi:MAG: formylglycine-generating enzyme family protein [Planctomycetaceae bacterium]